jgi:hypothetical protein
MGLVLWEPTTRHPAQEPWGGCQALTDSHVGSRLQQLMHLSDSSRGCWLRQS